MSRLRRRLVDAPIWRGHRGKIATLLPAAPGFALPLALGLMACDGSSSSRLLIYSPHGRDLLAFFEASFEQEHPGIKVEYVDMGSQEVLDRVRSEKANPQGDVWWGAPAEMFGQAADEGLLEPFAASWADAVPPEARDPGNLWLGTFLTPEVIAYNEEAIPADQVPHRWDEVLDPRWRGQVLIRDPLASGTMRAIFAAIMVREYERTGSFEAGYDWLLRLDAQTKDYVLNPTLLYQKLARQEGLLTLWDMPDIETLRSSTDLPIAYVIPTDGTPVVVDGIAVIRGTSVPELARTFVEFAGSRPALEEAARRFFRIPARTDIPPDSLPEWLREALPRIHPMNIDRAFVRANAPAWLRHWDREIRGRGRKRRR
ncbi:MAG: extracellular solute-binding protein [Gemmatimonadota bacterium]